MLHEAVPERPFRLRSAINAAILDSVMIGVARRLQDHEIEDVQSLRQAYDSLLSDEQFLGLVERTTANEERVYARLAVATAAFASVR
jgi:hypothetical protein